MAEFFNGIGACPTLGSAIWSLTTASQWLQGRRRPIHRRQSARQSARQVAEARLSPS